MKKILSTIMWLGASLLVIFVIAGMVIAVAGKPIIEKELTAMLKIPVTVQRVRLNLPLLVRVENLSIGDLAKVEQLSFSPNIVGLVAGKMVFSRLRIVNPVIHLIKAPDGSFNLPQFESEGKAPPVFVTDLSVKNGKVIYTDEHIQPQGATITAAPVNVEIAKVVWPLASLRTQYRLSAVFTGTDGKEAGTLSGSGWVDFGPKDMDGSFTLKDFQATILSPYYGDFISTRDLSSATLNATSTLKARNNDLVIQTNVQFSNMVYAHNDFQQQAQDSAGDLYRTTLDFFSDRQGNISFTFTMRTKLDKPAFGQESIKKAMVQAAGSNLLSQPPADIAEKIQQTVETFKAIGKEFKAKFREKQ